MVGLCAVVYGLLFYDLTFTSAKASPSPSLDFSTVSGESGVTVAEGATYIALMTPDALYETKNDGAAGVVEFLAQSPSAGDTDLLPENFQEEAQAARFIEDETTGEAHYFYQQNIDGVPVFGSQLAVHQRDNEIYALTGNISNSDHVFTGPLTEERARKIALDEALNETSAELSAVSAEKVIFNGKALGVSDDPGNYLSYSVIVESKTKEVIYSKRFIVNTTNGEIVFTEELAHEAISRKVSDCNNSSNCSVARSEGEGATGKTDVDSLYDIFGKYYSYFSDNYQRDGFDNKGSAMVGYVQYRDQTCPNAWMSRGQVYFCNGLLADDVASHEMTHAMNQSGPKFVYANQSGAIDESLADIFASAIDGNFTMGESTQLGTIRSMEEPGNYGQPDRLFSPNYYCASQDYGGVHKNGGVIAKAFHLMAQGGSFNTCTITGVGLDKVYPIFYKASTSYMRSSSNFKDVYNAVLQACGDLYGGATSATCIQVRNAMRATEMDQQTEGTQKGPKCENKQAQKPDCSEAPDPGTPTATLAPGAPTPTAKPGAATPTPGAPQKVTLDMTIRMQGVFSKPARSAGVPVEVKLAGPKETLSATPTFEWQNNGTLKGKVEFASVTPGTGYTITFRPPLHITRRICDTGPIEIFEGQYRCFGQTITLKAGSNTIDASGILQVAGDIPDESGARDNVINSADMGYVRANLGKTDATAISRADLNYDNAVDLKDYNIINISSTVKPD